MPTQLQLEGPDLETLLARVRAEHGASARIVRAEKVRSGGVGGFFAKQHFEINVEIEDLPAAAPAPAAAPRVTSILDLADQVSAHERSTAVSSAVSTESTGFAAVLAGLGATAGEPDLPGVPVVPQQRRATSPTTRPRRTAAPAPAAAPTPVPAAAAPARRRPATGRSVAPRPAAAGATAVRTVRPPQPSVVRPAPGTALAVRPGSALAVRAKADAPVATGRRAVARSSGMLAAAARSTAPAVTDLQAQLTELGLPAHLQPSAPGPRLHAALVASLRTLPQPPRTSDRAGAVLAILGPLPLATEVARQVARELDLPRSAVVQAGSALRTPEQARNRRATWSRRARTTIVVLETPLTAAGALRSRALLDALEPTTTWGVVEATRKPRDVGAWTSAVGHVDALALTGVDETADPASVLHLGIPVARLGARKATAAAWAGLLADRVAA